MLISVVTPGLHGADAVRSDEDGYNLWLRYPNVTDAALKEVYRTHLKHFCLPGDSDTVKAVRGELGVAVNSMLGVIPEFSSAIEGDGTLVAGTPGALRKMGLELPVAIATVKALGSEGYRITSATIDGRQCILIVAGTDVGVLYGTFHLIRLIQTNSLLKDVDITEIPRIQYRVLNHWDFSGPGRRSGRTVRVYSENPLSIWWNSEEQPPVPLSRYKDYARACASVGINATILNCVNATPAVFLPKQLKRAQIIADILRPYGIRVGLCPNFGAPLSRKHPVLYGPGIGNLNTSDPGNPEVISWWRHKTDEIYGLIPDFLGYLVKASSEGMPGPEKYGKHAYDGANMFAKLVAPHGGIVMWRTFTWDHSIHSDHVQRQYLRFRPMDGKFHANVVVQTKYGPGDFLPREPVHPLFGTMPNSQMSLELQITQEFTGHDKYLMFWPTYWKEVLDTDTCQTGPGDTVARIIDGGVNDYTITHMAGVANVSRCRNWTGHHFAQANWYGYGRQAWDHRLDPAAIAEEWARMTWTNDNGAVPVLVRMMLQSHPAVVDYSSPMGLAHLMEGRHNGHYEPTPVAPGRGYQQFLDQYVGAKPKTLGNDRTVATGTGATGNFSPMLRDLYENIDTCPETALLWFHKVGWEQMLPNGKTLWVTITGKFDAGVTAVEEMVQAWQKMEGKIDAKRYNHVKARLDIQLAHAKKFRRVWLVHFHELNGLPLPASVPYVRKEKLRNGG